MNENIKCKAEDKLNDTPYKDFPSTVTDRHLDEYLRRQLQDEVDVAVNRLNLVLASIKNNYPDCYDKVDYTNASIQIDMAEHALTSILEDIKKFSQF